MDPLIVIIALGAIIIISHFLNIYSENTGVPSVLILIFFGAILQLDTQIAAILFPEWILDYESTHNKSWEGVLGADNVKANLLEILGVGGLILILLEAALDLKINKTMIVSSSKAFFVALFGLLGSSFLMAYLISSIFAPELDLLHALLYSVPLSIISSAIIIPSIESFNEEKKGFLIYESTFSDVLGILMFQVVVGSLATGAIMSSGEIIGKLVLSILFSIIISIILIYLFQKIKGHTKLFLLFSILILLYAVAEKLHLSALLIVLIFGIILNNYKSVFVGFLAKIIEPEKVDAIQDDFKMIMRESAFVVRTFFFVLFGYYVSFESLFTGYGLVIFYSLILFAAIYFVRFILIFPTFKGRYWPEVFLSPRGLITILLFFQITDQYICDMTWHNQAEGVLLFIILGSAFTMSNALIGVKKLEAKKLKEEKLKIAEEQSKILNKEWLKDAHNKQMEKLKEDTIESNDKFENNEDIGPQQDD
ncbi:MAG: sodium:proton exchanger [Flavobacteriales bacterium]|nr:sodium:proton exchanger [Flavobacteriales bacterium]|tara:strand:- start:64 stop:1503 length:1440 start_codon:yes stop_codon:yes gene_type:complete